MRLILIAATMLVAAATLAATVPVARAQDCQSLWVERNTYYKQAGYCFRTPRAIQYFGNEGCRYTSEAQIRFPPDVRRRIQEIIRLERAMNCPR